jgi:hypothetical protein
MQINKKSNRNLTIFMVAHRTTILKYCDEIIQLEKYYNYL